MSEIVKPEYRCPQKDLYSIEETSWENFDGHQGEMGTHKALYTTLYSDAAKAAIAAAKAMPDAQERGETAESLRVELVLEGETCRHNFRKIKSYIISAYPNKDLHKGKFEAAGQLYYEDASNEDWESVNSLNQSGSNYIAANSAALLAGNNMPAGFELAFNTAKTSFAALYTAFKDAEQTSEQTAEKIKANNAIFRIGSSMRNDGQLVFSDRPEIAVKFQFQSIWDLINPPVSGVKGNVKRASDNIGISGATITVQEAGEPAETTETNAAGDYSIRLAAATYMVTVSAAGFVSQTRDGVVIDGSYKTLDFNLVAV